MEPLLRILIKPPWATCDRRAEHSHAGPFLPLHAAFLTAPHNAGPGLSLETSIFQPVMMSLPGTFSAL